MMDILLFMILLGMALMALIVPLGVAVGYGYWNHRVGKLEGGGREGQEADPVPGLAVETADRIPAPPGMRHDVELGFLYLGEPPREEQDDLTRIHGVAEVLQEKLHRTGVFTYWQIARWSDEEAERFSERLAFPGRISRDGWREHCEALYEKKYGKPVPREEEA